MRSWCQTNVSQTIYFNPNEADDIATLIHNNWDNGYVGTAFMLRYDPTIISKDTYLPQTPVTEQEFNTYLAKLKPLDINDLHIDKEFNKEAAVDNCDSGQCGLI